VVYLGYTLGAVMASVMLDKVPPKIFLFTCIVCNISTLIYFTITDDFSNLLICRMLTGLFQIFFGVY
jgi:predicted MFS family arabinose efflux permease